jgi:replicative superfamily II helicase
LETIDELEEFLGQATQPAIRDRLLDRGAAWAIMRQAGHLPEDAPAFGSTIDTDLADYGFSLLRGGLRLKEMGGSLEVAQRAFDRAANAFESLVRNGSPEALERGFYRVIAGAAYHLAGFSAIAYSLFSEYAIGLNVSPAEDALILLILRDLDALSVHTRNWLLDETHSDRNLTTSFASGELEQENLIAIILNSTICRALAYFDFALQTGEASLLETAKVLLTAAVKLAGDEGSVPLWWIARLCLSLIDDLWQHSLHMNLPADPPEGGTEKYSRLRELFLASLYGRKTAEVELWPSQLVAARRSSDLSDDLVVALPTSAGKTRVAELAALMTLSTGKRVLIVTPLRALSAQTERSFRNTFAPLGFAVSSLYGASGISAGDEDALRSKNIVIATPEKLDFALRNDANLIDDVGLIILDEGHMIGPTEREIRYEILVQRLIRRTDAEDRRIVCLSAILPDGEQLDDLTAWIRGDVKGEPVKSDWRPTRQRFGTVMWRGTAARLSFDLNDDGPYLARFVERMPARGKQKKPFPNDTRSLTLAAAWNFAAQSKRTLIFCTQRNTVEGYGRAVIDFTTRGYLSSLLDKPQAIERALEVGREWLGDDHPAVKCLKFGVAIHHGRLPNPFLREVELLLSQGVLKVTIASPTLAQGLNLNAAVLLVPSLYRAGKLLSGEEFANVAGRAGRAFVDVEGLVVHVMHKGEEWRLEKWRHLVASAKSRTLRSGLIQIVTEILDRLAQTGVLKRDDALEYLANSRQAWKSHDDKSVTEREEDHDEDNDDDVEPLSHLVEKLDAAVFGLIEALDADSSELPRLLDEALKGSLWERQIDREAESMRNEHKAILAARAQLIWKHSSPEARKGHFAMGVGLESGLTLDGMADELEPLLDKADDAALAGDTDELVEALVGLAKPLLAVRPFTPDKANALPEDWKSLLAAWVTGVSVETIGSDNMRVVEEAFAYRLVWAVEALRTRRMTLGWSSDTIAGGASASLETGVPQLMMAMLIRAGLPSRQAAINAVRDGDASFVDGAGMRIWLESNGIVDLSGRADWPTSETAALWRRFREEVLRIGTERWRVQNSKRALHRDAKGTPPPIGTYRLQIEANGDVWLCTPDYHRLVRLRKKLKAPKSSLFAARVVEGDTRAHIQRFGHGRAIWLDRAGSSR